MVRWDQREKARLIRSVREYTMRALCPEFGDTAENLFRENEGEEVSSIPRAPYYEAIISFVHEQLNECT